MVSISNISCFSSSKILSWTGKYELEAIAGVRVGKYNIGTRAGKCKVSVRVGKYKLRTRPVNTNLGRGPGPGGQAKGAGAGNTKTRFDMPFYFK